MDIGKLRKNNSFYVGYEDEPGIALSLVDLPEMQVQLWEGYLEDILETADISEEELLGFTKEYQECAGIFGEEESELIDADTYLKDLMKYDGNGFQYEETSECLNLLEEFLAYARENKSRICCQRL